MTDPIPDPIPANERSVNTGGLMRCCIQTVRESDALTDVGDVWDCKYEPAENATLIVDDEGYWRWNR